MEEKPGDPPDGSFVEFVRQMRNAGRSDDHIMYHVGRDDWERGEKESGIAKLLVSAALAPHFRTYEKLGEYLLSLGNTNEAIVFLSAAVGFGSGQTRARYLLAQAMVRIGDTISAVKKLDEAIAIQPCYNAARSLREEILVNDPRAAAYFRAATHLKAD